MLMATTKYYLEFARSIEERIERGEQIDPEYVRRLCEIVYEVEKTSGLDTVFRDLVDWYHSHKAREVRITGPNSYAAGCWSIELDHELGETKAAEAAFFTCSKEDGGRAAYIEKSKQQGVVYANVNPDGTEYQYDWPGLRNTVRAALDAFNAGIYKKRE
jgi:hypothetical protein